MDKQEMELVKATLFACIAGTAQFASERDRLSFSTKSGGYFVCPSCGGSAAAFVPSEAGTQKFMCYSCGAKGDRIDYGMLLDGGVDRGEAVRQARMDAGLRVGKAWQGKDDEGYRRMMAIRRRELDMAQRQAQEHRRRWEQQSVQDARRLLGVCLDDRRAADMAMQARGIDLRRCRFSRKVGFVRNFELHAKDGRPYRVTGVTFATGVQGDSVKVRNVQVLHDPPSSPSDISYGVSKHWRHCNVGAVSQVFCIEELDQDQSVFVVEGEIDALSCQCLGYHALALAGAKNHQVLVDEVRKRVGMGQTVPPLVIALDGDEAGSDGTRSLLRELGTIPGLRVVQRCIGNGCKDANELLCRDRQALWQFLAEASKAAMQSRQVLSRADAAMASWKLMW